MARVHVRLTALLLAAAAATAQGGSSFEPIAHSEEGVNFVGAVVGHVPEFLGSRDDATGIAPMARWHLGGERFIQLLGTEVTVNLREHPRWRAGPSVGVRFGRREVSDPVVREMRPVASTGEVGAFVDHSEPLGSDPLHRWGFNIALTCATGSVYSGLVGTTSIQRLQP